MATYTPSDMDFMYDQMNRFSDRMGRTYDAMRPDYGRDYAPAGDRRRADDMPRFFEEWDSRRTGESYPRRSYEGSRPGYESERGDYRYGARSEYYPRADYRGMDYYPRGDYRSEYRGMDYYPRGDYRADSRGMDYYPRGDYRSEYRGADYRSDYRADYRSDYRADSRGMDYPRGDYRSEYYPRGRRSEFRGDDYRGEYRGMDYPRGDYRGEYYPRGRRSEYRGDYRGEYYPRADYRGMDYSRGDDYSGDYRSDYRGEYYPRGDYTYPRDGFRGMSYPYSEYYPRGDYRSDYRGRRNEFRGDYRRAEADYRPEGEYMRGREMMDYSDSAVEMGRRYELREVDGEFVCICELPGFERSDIECTYEDGVFYIDAAREGRRDADNVWMRRSRRVSERIPVPRPVDVEGFTASYRKGILEVRMPVAGRDRRKGQVITIRD
ncbi:Hsp20/alpha crystallin family protein [Haloarchaeobius sp. HME9146]|uniref:Hsp20/alpha crystallin family protein n=1 Tax=Haloarchaeobius sp. HME9146 TaxID=2978732 RepID=UPI0021BDFF87|nr:Hsp20 family protein [Haloarchaeobius sp. HME9146]MCT9095534.1 Hsp20 family protein [Haloarchaeobius sp. HME9146]